VEIRRVKRDLNRCKCWALVLHTLVVDILCLSFQERTCPNMDKGRREVTGKFLRKKLRPPEPSGSVSKLAIRPELDALHVHVAGHAYGCQTAPLSIIRPVEIDIDNRRYGWNARRARGLENTVDIKVDAGC
jgi:hypothetical protein